MQNKSKREKLKELRTKRRNEKNASKREKLLKQIINLEDELLKEEFGDENLDRFFTE